MLGATVVALLRPPNLPPGAARVQGPAGRVFALLSRVYARPHAKMAAMEASAPSHSRTWIRLAWVLVPAAAFLALLAIPALRQGTPQPGDAAPDFEAPLLEGDGVLALEDLAGRPVVLNFWASWCAPCEDEAPLLKDAYERYGDEVAFVGVNIKDARSDALAFDDEWGLDYPDVRDEGNEIFRDYGLTGQPETFFLDGDGVIVEHVNGPLLDEATLSQLLDTLVSRGAGGSG